MAEKSAQKTKRRPSGLVTKQELKIAAQKLFAERGLDGVTVQEIVLSAGQRNNASLHYHFGNKEELARQLVIDGAKLIDERRQKMLDDLELTNKINDLREIMNALILPVTSISTNPDHQTYLRFIANLQFSKRQFLRDALGDRWNIGYRRCLDHFRRTLTDIPPPLLEQRLSLVGIYGNAILAAREEALQHERSKNEGLWQYEYSLENVIDTLLAVLEGPPSLHTLELLRE